MNRSILSHIIYLKNKYNILDINIEDDAFNVSIKRAKIIFKLIIDANLNLNIAFPNGVRADRIDEELIILMKKAGVYRIAFGIESASAKNLQLIQKHLNLETVTDSIELATRHNINTHGFFILGFPDETEEEMQQTVDYALKSRLCTAHFALLKIFKGTELYRHAVLKYGLSTELPTLAGGSYTRVNENFSKVPADRIYHIRKVAYIRFLCSPSRIYRVFNTLPQKKYLFVQAYNFFKKIIFPPK